MITDGEGVGRGMGQPDSTRNEVPNQVPAPVPGFVNRVPEMALLGGAAHSALVRGLAGVGKTAMVRTWAARNGERFPDGLLYLDFAALRTPDGTAVSDGHAEILRSLGVRDDDIPLTPAGRANLYRTKLANKRYLVVLDDVTESAHVLPFLPNTPGSLVVATSNEMLADLGLDGVHPVDLKPLTAQDAELLLRQSCPDGRLAADPTATADLARLCGRLPAALRVAAARLLARPRLTVGALVDELADDGRRLAGLTVRGERVVSAVFDNSYRALNPSAAALYRALGSLPLRDFSRELVTSLGDGDALDALVQAHLLEETEQERLVFHSLVALHAKESARAEESRGRLDDVLGRVLAHYLRLLGHADRAVMGDRLRITEQRPTGANPFSGKGAGLAWMVEERANLLALVRAAERAGHDDAAWQLAEGLTALYFNRRYVADWLESAELGAKAAHRAGNPAAEARLRSVVSRAYTDLGELGRAGEELNQARGLAARAGNPLLVASVWEFTGRYLDQADPPAAVAAYRQALDSSALAGSRRGAALATYFLGRALHAAGDHDEALPLLRHAREELRDDPRMANRVLASLGALYRDVGRADEARDHLGRAAAAFRESGATHYEAEALLELRATAGADVAELDARLRDL